MVNQILSEEDYRRVLTRIDELAVQNPEIGSETYKELDLLGDLARSAAKKIPTDTFT